MRTLSLTLLVLLAASLVPPVGADQPAITLQKTLMTGQTAPGIEPGPVDEIGAYVDVFNPDPFAGRPSIGLAGGIGVVARHGGDGDPGTPDGSGSGVWRQDAGTIQKIALEGETAPGTPGWPFTGFPAFSADSPGDHGQGLAFRGTVRASDGSDRTGLWSTRNGVLRKVLLEGEALPGIPAGATAFNFAFVARGPALVLEANWCIEGGCAFRDEGLFRDLGGMLSAVVKRGDPAPGFGRGDAFDDFSNASANTGPVHVWNANEQGRVIFNGYVRGSRVDSGNNEGLWAEGMAGLVLLAREGDKVPGKQGYWWGAGSGFQGFGDFSVMRTHVLTANGLALWGASVHNRRYNRLGGVWTNRTGQVVQVVQTVRREAGVGGQPPQSLATPAPGFGPGHYFRQVFSGRMNAQGEIYLDADVADAADAENPNPAAGIFHLRPGANEIELLVRRGGPVPGVPDVVFREARIGRLFAAGQYLWIGRFEGPGVDGRNDLAAFLTLPDGSTTLVLRTGDAVDVSGDGQDVRVLADFDMDSDPRGAGDRVEQAFELRFTDGSTGAFRGRVATN
jgi:hypothetical protein